MYQPDIVLSGVNKWKESDTQIRNIPLTFKFQIITTVITIN